MLHDLKIHLYGLGVVAKSKSQEEEKPLHFLMARTPENDNDFPKHSPLLAFDIRDFSKINNDLDNLAEHRIITNPRNPDQEIGLIDLESMRVSIEPEVGDTGPTPTRRLRNDWQLDRLIMFDKLITEDEGFIKAKLEEKPSELVTTVVTMDSGHSDGDERSERKLKFERSGYEVFNERHAQAIVAKLPRQGDTVFLQFELFGQESEKPEVRRLALDFPISGPIHVSASNFPSLPSKLHHLKHLFEFLANHYSDLPEPVTDDEDLKILKPSQGNCPPFGGYTP